MKKIDDELYKCIDYTPPTIDIKDTYPTDKYAVIKQADDEKLIMDYSGINYIILGLSLFGVIMFGYGFIVNESFRSEIDIAREGVPIYIFSFVLDIMLYLIFAGSLYFALYSVANTKKVFIFNRKEGTVTYPGLRWRTSNTIPFQDACFILNRIGPYGGEGFHLAILRGDGITRSMIAWDQPEKHFSLFVWYMDKNRPLPLGTAFDPYRQKDYERRKAEGFPKPLYGGRIPTPDIDGVTDRCATKPKKKLTLDERIEENRRILERLKEEERQRIAQESKWEKLVKKLGDCLFDWMFGWIWGVDKHLKKAQEDERKRQEAREKKRQERQEIKEQKIQEEREEAKRRVEEFKKKIAQEETEKVKELKTAEDNEEKKIR